MKLCSSQAQEALIHLATQTQPLPTSLCEPEEHSTADMFYSGLVLSNSSLLSYMTSCICRIFTFLEWKLLATLSYFLLQTATQQVDPLGSWKSSCKSVKISVLLRVGQGTQQWRQTLVSKQRLLVKQVFPASQVLIQTMPGFLLPCS